MKIFYDKIKTIRKQRKLSTAEFCQKIGIGRSTLWTWETGRQSPTEKKVELIAEGLGVSVNEISDLTPKKEKSTINLSETANSLLLLNNSTVQKKIIEQEEIIKKIKVQQSELLQASIVIQAIMSTMQSSFYVKDNNLKYVFANDFFLKNSSLQSDFNVIGKDDSAFFSSKEALKNSDEDHKVFKTGNPIIKAEGYIPGSRKKKMGLISKFPLIDSLGKIAGIVGTFVDITEQKKLEKEKGQLKIHQMLEATFSTPTEVLWLISYYPKREYLYISSSIEKMLGYPAEIFYSNNNFWLENCVYPDYRKEQSTYMNTGNCPEKMEYRLITSKGKIIWVEEFTFKETFHGKQCIGFITRDITARKKKEEKTLEEIKQKLIDKLQQENIDSKILDKISKIILI